MIKSLLLRLKRKKVKEAAKNRRFRRRFTAWPPRFYKKILSRFGSLTDSVMALQRNACETQIRELLRAPRYADPLRLEHFAFKVFSQHGEDGIIQEIFRRIGTTNKRFVEFGVADGLQCNTHLLLYSGWRGLWIEGDPNVAPKIRRVFADPIKEGSLKLQEGFVTAENINAIIANGQVSGEIDLLTIDIDGNDYHVCRSISAVMPRVIVAEYNASFPPPLEWVKPYESAYAWDYSMYFGASLAAYAHMLAAKGFTLVGTDLCGVNAFFVRNDVVGECFTQAGDVTAHYNPPRYFLGGGYPSGHLPVFSKFTSGTIVN
jgi:hypothetical protein